MTRADAALDALSQLGTRLELSAAAGLEIDELAPMASEIDRLAHAVDPNQLTVEQRGQVARTVAQLARILTCLQARQAEDLNALGREDRVRRAYASAS